MIGQLNAGRAYTPPAGNNIGGDSFASYITRIMPNGSAPLFALTSMLNTETATQVEHGFYTKTMVFPSATIAGGAVSNTATTLTVVSTDEIVPGMVLQTHTTENILVASVTNATTLVVVRGTGTSPAAAIADNSTLFQVGNASEEGSSRPVALSLDQVRISNLTQIFRNSWDVTGTVAQTTTIVGDGHVAESRRDCAGFHAADIERALFFGQKHETTRNGKPLRFMDGVISIVSSMAPGNVSTAGATTNWEQLENMLDPVFDQITDPKYANERLLFVGSKALKVINNIGRLSGEFTFQASSTSWGLQFKEFKTTRGTFSLIEHPLFNSNANWSSMAVALDLTTFNIAYLGNRKTKSKEYSSDSAEGGEEAVDASYGVLTTEATCLVKNAPANAVIYGLTKAVAS